MARLATAREKLVANGPNLVALATPQVATSSHGLFKNDVTSNFSNFAYNPFCRFVLEYTTDKQAFQTVLPIFEEITVEIVRPAPLHKLHCAGDYVKLNLPRFDSVVKTFIPRF